MDSLELIQLIKSNKREGLSVLYDRYAGALYGMILRIANSEKQAEEILQTSLIKIVHTIDHYEAKQCTFFIWMNRIARQEALVACEGRQQALAALNMKASQDISVEQKKVLDCIHLYGYTTDEVASHLNVSCADVKSIVYAAVTNLRKGIIRGQTFGIVNLLILSYFLI